MIIQLPLPIGKLSNIRRVKRMGHHVARVWIYEKGTSGFAC